MFKEMLQISSSGLPGNAMRRLLLVSILVSVVSSASAQAPSEHLAPLVPFVGKTWYGTFQNYPGGSTPTDVSKWEWVLNGQAVQITHSVDEGEYGGMTIIMWNGAEETLVAHYFTTAGFMTRATIMVDGATLISREEVSGHPSITAVEAESRILDDGRLHTRSRYLRDGEWIDGHEIIYRESPDAVVRFRTADP